MTASFELWVPIKTLPDTIEIRVQFQAFAVTSPGARIEFTTHQGGAGEAGVAFHPRRVHSSVYPILKVIVRGVGVTTSLGVTVGATVVMRHRQKPLG
jgi:hypothetical protein